MREEMRLQMTPDQQRLANHLAPYFGMRSGVSLAFGLLSGMISEFELASVLHRHPALELELEALVQAIGPARE